MFETLMNQTPVGIGIDLVFVESIKDMQSKTKGSFYQRTFTAKEREEAASSQDEATYLAGRFASKEATFKAIAPLLPSKSFDFRIVETLKREDGSPFIQPSPELRGVMEEAGIQDLLVSISNENGYAIAIVQAIRNNN